MPNAPAAAQAANRYESYAMFDEAGQILLETTSNVSQYPCLRCRDPYVEYIYLDGMPIAALQDPNGFNGLTVTELYDDHLGTPRQASSAGSQSWAWEALNGNNASGGGNSFGTRANTGSGINLRFPGQQYDWQTGLNYNYMRFYEPRTGRYITSDPIGLGGGMNTYLYANGNPLMFSDRLGLVYGNGTVELEDIAFGPAYWINEQLGWDPSYDQRTLDFWAGAGDTASFGASGWIRDLNGTSDMVDKCSAAYLAGELTAVVSTPLGRGAYMYRAAQIPKLASTARQAISMRNMLRYTYRGPLTRIPFFAAWHMRTYLEFVAKGRTDAQIIANSGNISGLWNYIFGGITAAAAGSKIHGHSACNECASR